MVGQKEKDIDQKQEHAVMERIIRVKELQALTSLSRSTLWRLRQTSDFPPSIRLSPGVIGWRLSSVEEWLKSKEAATAAKRDEAV